MRIYLLRHGRTAYNAESRYQGRRDIPLSPSGEAELRAAGVTPERLYVSPLCRARRTAEIIFPETPQRLVPDLVEMDFGVFEGRTYKEMEQDASYRAWVDGDCAGRCPGGESLQEFCDRVCGAFAQVVQESRGCGEIAVVAHGGVLMGVMERFALPEKSYFQWHVPCGGGFLLETAGDDWDGESRLRLLEELRFGKDDGV